jgi:hypothetical protein
MARGSLAQPALLPHGRATLRYGGLEPAARATHRAITISIQRESGQKKGAAWGRADKGLEIFFVNEKVCFEKQRLQYIRCPQAY